MEKKVTKVTWVAVSVVMLLGLLIGSFGCAAPAPEPAAPTSIKWLGGIHIPRESGWDWYPGENFGKRVTERSGGRLLIRTMSFPELGYKGNEGLRIVKDQLCEVVASCGAYLAGEWPMVAFLNLPMFMPPLEQTQPVGEVYRELRQKELLDKFNAIELAYSELNPSLYFFVGTAPKRIEDFKGRKMRVNGLIPGLFVEALGATPLVIAGPELYISLQQGICDSVVTLPGFAYGLALYEVLDYYVNTAATGCGCLLLMVNKDSFNELPSDLQKLVLDTAKEIEDEARVTARSIADENLAKLRAEGLQEVFLDPGELDKMGSIGVPLWEKWYNEMADEPARQAFDAVRKYLGK